MVMFDVTLSPRSSAWLLRSSGASPTPASTADCTEPGRSRLPADVDGAGVALAGAEHGLHDLGAAGTDQAGEAERPRPDAR